MEKSTCVAFGCEASTQVGYRGYCVEHYSAQAKRSTDPTRYCEVQDCNRPVNFKTLCAAHGQRLKAYGSATPPGMPPVKKIDWPVCQIGACERPARTARGTVCNMHGQRIQQEGESCPTKSPDPCAADDCERPARFRSGLCSLHYQRKRTYGDPNAPVKWKKGVRKPDNYIYVTVVDEDGSSRQVPEHRVVMESVLGRALRAKENVHHKNGDRHDNRPDNLELWTTSQPAGQRVDDKIAYAIEILEQYAPHLLERHAVSKR